jgi:hypothetical protein
MSDNDPCLRQFEEEDQSWSCLNDHTGCLWNDGHNGCSHPGSMLQPLEVDALTPKVRAVVQSFMSQPPVVAALLIDTVDNIMKDWSPENPVLSFADASISVELAEVERPAIVGHRVAQEWEVLGHTLEGGGFNQDPAEPVEYSLGTFQSLHRALMEVLITYATYQWDKEERFIQ